MYKPHHMTSSIRNSAVAAAGDVSRWWGGGNAQKWCPKKATEKLEMTSLSHAHAADSARPLTLQLPVAREKKKDEKKKRQRHTQQTTKSKALVNNDSNKRTNKQTNTQTDRRVVVVGLGRITYISRRA